MNYRVLFSSIAVIAGLAWMTPICTAQVELGVALKGGRTLITQTESKPGGSIEARSGNWFGFGLIIRDRIQKDKQHWMRAEIGLARSSYIFDQTNGSLCCNNGDSAQVTLTQFYAQIAPEFQLAGKTSLYIPVQMEIPLSSKATGFRYSNTPPNFTYEELEQTPTRYGMLNVCVGLGLNQNINLSGAYTLAVGPSFIWGFSNQVRGMNLLRTANALLVITLYRGLKVSKPELGSLNCPVVPARWLG